MDREQWCIVVHGVAKSWTWLSDWTELILKEMGYQTTLPASWETCMQDKKQQLEPDMEKHWFKIGKGVCQGCILSPCLFNLHAEYIMQNAGIDEAQAGSNQDCWEKYQ